MPNAPKPVTVREEPAVTVVYLRRQGAFRHIPEALEALYAHLQQHQLTPAGPPIGVFFDDPRSVPEERARWEVRWAVAERPAEAEPGDDGVGVRVLPMRRLAVLTHVGPYDQVGPVYQQVATWVDDHGYRVVGPPEEAYLSEPDTPPSQIRTEVRFPVERAAVARA